MAIYSLRGDDFTGLTNLKIVGREACVHRSPAGPDSRA